MKKLVIKTLVRSRFRFSTGAKVERKTRCLLKAYLQLAQGMNEMSGSRPVKVSKMLGVDENMREWSFFELLRHNTIVNQAITGTVYRLVRRESEPVRKFDVKNDVMPGPDCGIEQIALFKSSVLDHLEAVRKLDCLKGTREEVHPIFGSFDAHQWNCMFAFHLEVHLKQASSIKGAVLESFQ